MCTVMSGKHAAFDSKHTPVVVVFVRQILYYLEEFFLKERIFLHNCQLIM